MTERLRAAAQALVNRWDSPQWGGSAEHLRHTGEYIAALRAALAEQPAEQVPLTFETAAEAKADREHAEAYYRQAEHLLTANERTLHAEIARLEAQLAEQPSEQEPVYAFRRKGQDDFCTCDEKRYLELSDKPNLFETRIFYTAPQPAKRVPLTDEEISALWLDSISGPLTATKFARAVERAHGIGEKT